jgi:hypothetical protein
LPITSTTKAALRGDRRLFDLVHGIDNAIERRVGAHAQFAARQVVVDGGWQQMIGYLKAGKLSRFRSICIAV